jgi:hypothetical protein
MAAANHGVDAPLKTHMSGIAVLGTLVRSSRRKRET